MKKINYAIGLFLLCLLVGCGSNSLSNLSAFSESNDISEDDLKVEESKDEVLNQLQSNSGANLEALISNHFPFVDSVTGEDTTANVYGTLLFEVEELADILSEIEQPDEKSDFIDGQQILMYSNDQFIILKESEEIPDATFIEVASEQFVRDNYSPNFLTTYFTIRMLDSVFGNNWVTNRRSYCSSNDCYGGYSTSRSYNNGNLSTNRGMGTFRGGGPSSGK